MENYLEFSFRLPLPRGGISPNYTTKAASEECLKRQVRTGTSVLWSHSRAPLSTRGTAAEVR